MNKPYLSRTKLASTAAAQGCVVSHEDGKTRIEHTDVVLTMGPESDIQDQDGKVYSVEDAFERLGLKVA